MNIMDAIEESLNPTTISHALYEMMMDWRECVMFDRTGPGSRRWRSKRVWLETALGRFVGKAPHEMRKMLEQHFNLEVPRGK